METVGGAPSRISPITDYLYLSGFACITEAKLQVLGITCIVDATNVPRRDGRPGYDYVRVNVDDSEFAKLTPFFDDVADKIEAHRLKGGKTLVHCAAGISRSTSLVLAYLIKYQRRTLRDAYLFTRHKRSCVCPNTGFWKQLIEFEKATLGSNSVSMVSGRYAREIPDIYLSESKAMREFAEAEGLKREAYRAVDELTHHFSSLH